jgi:ERCC4-type nuclease
MVILFCDTRERAIQDSITAEFSKPPNFAKTKGEMVCEVKQVPVGDYAIEVEGQLMAVIERKTLKDYGASFKDNRHANKAKLINARNMSDCKIYYVIEGPLNPDYDSEFAGIKYKNILASIHDLMIKDGIFILRTQDGPHTARELRMLCESYIRTSLSEEAPTARSVISYDEVLAGAKLTAEEKLTKCRIEAWRSMPGVGNPTAIYLATQYPLANWITGKILLIEANNFSFNGRRNNKISKLLAERPSKELQIAILAAINGLTMVSAADIISQYSLEDLLADVDYSEVRYGAKGTKLTKSRIESIKMFLNETN